MFGSIDPALKSFTRDEGTIGGMELWVHAETATFIPEFLSMEDGSVLRAYASSFLEAF